MSRPHGGNLRKLAQTIGRPHEQILDFSANINPLGAPGWIRAEISRSVDSMFHYPDPDCTALVEAISRHHEVPAEQVVAGNGSTEILCALPRVLHAARALVPVPSYSDYALPAVLAGLDVCEMHLDESAGFAPDPAALDAQVQSRDVVYLGQPNNPTGLLCNSDALRRVAAENPSATFVVDEAFIDFVDGHDTLIRRRPPNMIVLRSMTKFYAIPGLRLGYAIADPALALSLRDALPEWSVNVPAQAIGERALGDEDYARRTREFVSKQRETLARQLSGVGGLTVFPGTANFLLVRIDRPPPDAPSLAKRLLEVGIAIRTCDNFSGLDERFFRVAVRTEEENERLCNALRSAFGGRARRTQAKKTATLMFQGTSSNAGKSIMASALCRILLQDGIRVAPFKSQNMSLNSHVTRDGGEMGRAQVVQAQACRLEPDVRMNPILLKPNSDTGCQVILRGKPVANMNVADYIRYKPRAFEAAKECYDSLAEEYDAVILEGAGSPAEVNLKHHDIVNMKMARYARSPVLLVGDIDRGGVFASFVGTMELLEQWERALVAGFVINQFRGDQSLLDPALEYTRRHTGRAVLGVVPYLHKLNLPEEDSVEFKSGRYIQPDETEEAVDVVIVDLPHISNFTDFDAFRIEPDVRLRVARTASDLDNADAIIIPGSKNVIGDFAHLERSGMAHRLRRAALLREAEIVGICAGFQILGRRISDPHHVESADGDSKGLGLLAADTLLAEDKTLVRASAKHDPSGLPVFGYEIHHGQTRFDGLVPAFRRSDGEVVGVATPDHRMWGTYLHGVFDADEFRRWFIDRLRERRGMAPLRKIMATYDLEPAFDRLAQVVRESLDMDEVYRVMGLR
ncbi:MAG: cobyric acid synthase [Planctomycetes bacterium]|nr:cobyric acid synthase [Planctomycetota bacterium]